MSISTTQVQFRRGLASDFTNFYGGTGEICVDLTNGRIVVFDTILAGGYTGAKLTDLNTAITNLSGYVNNNAGAAGISVLSGNLFQTGAILYSYILGTSGTYNHNDGLNISGNLTATGISLINRNNAISGVLDTKIQSTGTILYNDIIGLSGQCNSNFATNTNLTLTGQILLSGLRATGQNLQNQINNITGGGSSSLVYTTGNQIISGSKTFQNIFNSVISGGFSVDTLGNNTVDFANRILYNNLGVAILDWGNNLLTDSSDVDSIDWNNRRLIIDNGADLTTLDWQKRILSGNWNATSLYISGSPVITAAMTGGFGGGGTGVSIYNQSGSYIFTTNATSGLKQQFINFPTSLGNNPYVISSLNNTIENEIILVQSSGITSSGYWAQYSNWIDNTGYLLTTLASISTQTGLATTVIINNYNITGNTTGSSILTISKLTGNFNIQPSNFLYLVDTTLASSTGTFPDASGFLGYKFIIKDWKGTSATNNIRITGINNQTFDGSYSVVINNNYSTFDFISDGSNWGIY